MKLCSLFIVIILSFSLFSMKQEEEKPREAEELEKMKIEEISKKRKRIPEELKKQKKLKETEINILKQLTPEILYIFLFETGSLETRVERIKQLRATSSYFRNLIDSYKDKVVQLYIHYTMNLIKNSNIPRYKKLNEVLKIFHNKFLNFSTAKQQEKTIVINQLDDFISERSVLKNNKLLNDLFEKLKQETIDLKAFKNELEKLIKQLENKQKKELLKEEIAKINALKKLIEKISDFKENVIEKIKTEYYSFFEIFFALNQSIREKFNYLAEILMKKLKQDKSLIPGSLWQRLIDKLLGQAVVHNNPILIKDLVKEGGDINVSTIQRNIPIQLKILALGNLNTLYELLDSTNKAPKLFEAIKNNQDFESIENLYRNRLKNEKWNQLASEFKLTPLMLASYYGNLKLVQFLLQEPEAKEKSKSFNQLGLTALDYAAMSGNEQIIDVLIKEIDFSEQLKYRALLNAINAGQLKIAKKFLKNEKVNELFQKGKNNIFLGFIKEQRKKALQSLMELGINLNIINQGLLFAVKEGYIDIINLLLQNIPTTVIEKNNLPLIMASSEGYLEIAEELIQAGFDVNKSDEGGYSPLMAASTNKGNIAVVKALLKAGAQINAKDDDGTTALGFASDVGNAAVVKELLKADAHVNVKDNKGMTPLMYASINNNIAVVKELLEAEAFVNATDNRGMTSLIYASAHGNTEIVRKLLNAGANVNLADKKGNTPLMAASIKNNIEVVRELLNAGADTNVTNAAGVAALGYAAESGNIEIVRELLEAGARVTNLALEIARYKNNFEIVRLLEEAQKKSK